MNIRRRSALALAPTALLAACGTSGGSGPSPTRTRTASPTTRSVGKPRWDNLAAELSGSLVRPADKSFQSLKKVENPRYDDARPLALLRAKGAKDVAAGLKFAAHYEVPIAVRAGGHNYAGWSAGGAPNTHVPRSLVIDVREMDSVHVAADHTASVGAGAQLIDVYSALAEKGRAIAAGSCPTVGVTGLTLGGGVGVLTREFGLTSDQVESVEIVTADGEIRVVDSTNDPDLLWACRGGGGGQFGVVTGWKFRTRAAPTISVFFLEFPSSRAADVIDAWQRWAPTADNRLWSTCKYLSGADHATPVLKVAGTWVGTAGLDDQLRAFTDKAGTPTSRFTGTHSYLDTMLLEAGCSKLGVRACHIGHGGELHRETLSATSHIARRKLSRKAIGTLTSAVERARSIDGLIEGGVSLDALGGAVASVGSDDTAFAYRDALASVQYTATWDSGKETNGSPYDDYVHDLRSAMIPSWGSGAYVNYADPRLKPSAYFAGHVDRLRSIKHHYDPHGLFDQPRSV